MFVTISDCHSITEINSDIKWTIFQSSLLAVEEDAEVSDGELRLRLEPGEVLPALGDHHGVSPRVALEDVDLWHDIINQSNNQSL